MHETCRIAWIFPRLDEESGQIARVQNGRIGAGTTEWDLKQSDQRVTRSVQHTASGASKREQCEVEWQCLGFNGYARHTRSAELICAHSPLHAQRRQVP